MKPFDRSPVGDGRGSFLVEGQIQPSPTGHGSSQPVDEAAAPSMPLSDIRGRVGRDVCKQTAHRTAADWARLAGRRCDADLEFLDAPRVAPVPVRS